MKKLVVLFLALSLAGLAQDGLCSRCDTFVRNVGSWTGLDTNWPGLCANCADPERRCDESLRQLQNDIDRLMQGILDINAQLQEDDLDPLFRAALEAALRDLEESLDDRRALRDRLRRQCQGEAVAEALDGLNPGGTPGDGSNEDRDAPTGSEPVEDTVDVLDPPPGGGSNVGRNAPTGSLSQRLESHSFATDGADYLHLLTKATPVEAAPIETRDGLPTPRLLTARTPRAHAANALACARALEQLGPDPARARHGAYLAAEGQQQWRKALAEEARLARQLSVQFQRELAGRSPVEAFRALGAPDPEEATRRHYRRQLTPPTERPLEDAEWDLLAIPLLSAP